MSDLQSPEVLQSQPKKRNIWSGVEIRAFLQLIGEKHVLGLMYGKRIRTSNIFKSLIGPLKEMVFCRDVSQLMVKYKNLKAEYYKCKRHNAMSGQQPSKFEFLEEVDAILGSRPQAESLSNTPVIDFASLPEILINNENVPPMEIEFVMGDFDDQPDIDGAIPGCSSESGIKTLPVPITSSNTAASPTPSASPNPAAAPTSAAAPKIKCSTAGKGKGKKKKISEQADAGLSLLQTMLEENRREAETDRAFMREMIGESDKTLKECTAMLVKGLLGQRPTDSDSD